MNALPARSNTPGSGRLQVYFDGGCPLCRREIGFLRRRRGGEHVDWVDIAATDVPEVAPGLARCDALARMHGRTPEGRIVSGAAAFAAVWRALPLTRPLGWLFSHPLPLRALERAYLVFLRWRPRLQSWAARREGLAAGATCTGEAVGPVSRRCAGASTPPSASARRE
jgi:predicted DCC family thiol-disulfide oxidoreductase YuxK